MPTKCVIFVDYELIFSVGFNTMGPIIIRFRKQLSLNIRFIFNFYYFNLRTT